MIRLVCSHAHEVGPICILHYDYAHCIIFIVVNDILLQILMNV